MYLQGAEKGNIMGGYKGEPIVVMYVPTGPRVISKTPLEKVLRRKGLQVGGENGCSGILKWDVVVGPCPPHQGVGPTSF